jgi:TetR/AcrR family transcriptional regulator, transcriptional repressor for nem operon
MRQQTGLRAGQITMRMTPDNKDKARAAIVEAAGRLFREQGVAGTGVDAIARELGQTSGAFYAHFPSKTDVFREAVEAGFARLIGGIRRTGEAGGARWAARFAQRYLSPARRDAVGQGCLLPTLANDAARAGGEVHRLFGEMLSATACELAQGCGENGERSEDRAFAILALCAGGLMLARAVSDEATSDGMLRACRHAAEALIAGDQETAAHSGRGSGEGGC